MSLSRRSFVQTLGAGAAATWVASRGREGSLFGVEPLSGDAARTCFTMSATVVLPCAVAVGLLGLQKNTRPAPLDASTSLLMSMRSLSSSATSLTGVPIFLAVSRGASNDGHAVTSGLVAEVNARTALVSSSPDPAPSATFSAFAANFAVSAVTIAPSDCLALKG